PLQRDADHLPAPPANHRRAHPRDPGRRARAERRRVGRARHEGSHLMAARDLPLSDVKVLDFMWVMAGPAATRVLADYGATVVRLEAATRVETARTLQPYWQGQANPEHSGLFWNMNAGKLGVTVDMGNPASRDTILDLVRWADVV